MRRLKAALANAGIVFASVLAALAGCELALRLGFPEYERAAASVHQAHQTRIWARVPNSHWWGRHPDTRERHILRYNDLGLRQHRNFEKSSWGESVNIGFFGDSFLENTTLPAQHMFTEILDHLLNAGGRGRFNVLNFGVDGYGPGQSFLHYQQFDGHLDHVFFVFCSNDIMNIADTGLFRLDEGGEPVSVTESKTSALMRLLSKLHVAYLVLDAAETFAVTWPEVKRREFANAVNAEIEAGFAEIPSRRRQLLADEQGFRLFGAVLARWKMLVEARGGTFHVVFLPIDAESFGAGEGEIVARARQLAADVEAATVDLLACAEKLSRPFSYDDVRFRRDMHWNESGNRLAARCLFRYIERARGGAPLPAETLAEHLRAYDAAFAATAPAADASAAPSAAGLVAIRRKYLALDLALSPPGLADLLLAARRDGPVARGAWDVYAPAGYLLYESAECTADARAARFFVHVVPSRIMDMPMARHKAGFIPIDFDFEANGWTEGTACRAGVKLPPFPLARVRTGQFVVREGESHEIWQVSVTMDGAERRGATR